MLYLKVGTRLGGFYSMMQAAFAYLRSHHLKARLTCSYLQHYVTKHPQYKDIIT